MAEERIMGDIRDLKQYSRSAAAEIAALDIPKTLKEGKYGSAAMQVFVAVSELGFAAGMDTIAFFPKVGVRASIAAISALDSWGQNRRKS